MKRVWLVRLMLGQQGVVAYILPIEAFVTGIENLDWQKSPLIAWSSPPSLLIAWSFLQTFLLAWSTVVQRSIVWPLLCRSGGSVLDARNLCNPEKPESSAATISRPCQGVKLFLADSPLTGWSQLLGNFKMHSARNMNSNTLQTCNWRTPFSVDHAMPMVHVLHGRIPHNTPQWNLWCYSITANWSLSYVATEPALQLLSGESLHPCYICQYCR